MKILILVRHAKSSWADDTLDDRDRPLNDRGKKDAPEMAKRLSEKGLRPDLFLSSPAKRARKTARIFVEEFGGGKKDIQEEEKLYEAPASRFYEVIRELDDQYKTVALFSHNPGITEFANSLGAVRIDDMPTCSVLAVRAHTDSWSGFQESKKEFLFFDFPKAQG